MQFLKVKMSSASRCKIVLIIPLILLLTPLNDAFSIHSMYKNKELNQAQVCSRPNPDENPALQIKRDVTKDTEILDEYEEYMLISRPMKEDIIKDKPIISKFKAAPEVCFSGKPSFKNERLKREVIENGIESESSSTSVSFLSKLAYLWKILFDIDTSNKELE